jgi:hypothetical protein
VILENIRTTHHISSYDDYDALMARVTRNLTFFDPPRNHLEKEYDVGDEHDHLDYAWGKDGVIRAYYLGQHSVKVIQMVKASTRSIQQEVNWFTTVEWRRALLVTEFSKSDLFGSSTHVTGKVITVDGGTSAEVIGVFDMDVDRGMWYNIINGLAWTYDSAVSGAGSVGSAFSDSLGANIDSAGDGLRSVGNGIVVVGGVIGDGLGTAGELIGDGLGSAVGGTTNFFGNIAYNMAVKAFYESGYIQAATTIAIVLVLIDLKKNKII